MRKRKVVFILSCIVVFLTVYSLVLPAITIDKETAEEDNGIVIQTVENTVEDTSENNEFVDKEEINKECSDNYLSEEEKAADDSLIESGESTNELETISIENINKDEMQLNYPAQSFDGSLDDTLVFVEAPEGSLPEGALMKLEEVDTDDDLISSLNDALADQKVGQIKAIDISFIYDGEEYEPKEPVKVNITSSFMQEIDQDPLLYHIDQKGDIEKVDAVIPDEEELSARFEEHKEIIEEHEQIEELNCNNTLSFETDSFSVYVIVYTVDFEYGIDGNVYEHSIKGGSFIALRDLNSVLGIFEDNSFINDVESIVFSAPEYLFIEKIEQDKTIKEIIEENSLQIEYSADLSNEEIAEIENQIVKAPDWVLLSLKPFTSQESLTFTMKNGVSFIVNVTDAHEIPDSSSETIDVNKSYLICYETGDQYYLLKNDGSVDNSHTPDNFENLNSTYCWAFNYVFQEKHLEDTLTYVYYLIRPIDNKSKTIALNEEGQDLVQRSNNNVAVVPAEGGGFHLVGYNEIKLNFENNGFLAKRFVEGELGITVHIYEMDELPTYSYTVRSSDTSRGDATVEGGTRITEEGESYYYEADSNSDKKNAGTIRAIPVIHKNSELNPGDQGYNQNKWLFDHWEQDNVPLDRDAYPSTIDVNSLPIPFNGSNIVAYFRQNPEYVVPDAEKQPSSFEDLSTWISELTNREVPLDKEYTDKTAEVYDYENRIYRVDIVTKPNFKTFKGNVDMAFCMDVSNSMYFPSKLLEFRNQFSIYRLNDNKQWLDQSRSFNNPYYVIGDESGTATVFKLYYKADYNGGSWVTIDASKQEYVDGTKNFWSIGKEEFELSWSKATNKLYPLSLGDTINSTYTIYNAGDQGRNRFYYLNQSFSGALADLETIKNTLEIAGDDSPEVRFAYNTFNKNLGDQRADFETVHQMTIDLSNSHGGGTRPDQAFNDAKTFAWTGDDRYVILITDGAPQGVRTGEAKTTTIQQIDTWVREAAQQLKNATGVKMITIGLSMDKVPHGKKLLYDLADTDKDGNPMFYMAESASDLPNILRQVTKTIMDDAIVYSDITDTVGEAFYPVDKSTGLPLKAGDMIDIEGRKTEDNKNAAGVVQSDGMTINWNKQTLDPMNGWHGTVYVKAKEDLLGGNAVKTNSEAVIKATSYKVGDQEFAFDNAVISEKLKSIEISPETPRVNVNELVFPKVSTEWTVYLGTEVDPEMQLKKMYEEILVTQVVNTDGTLHYPIEPNSIVDDRTGKEIGNISTFKLAPLILELIKEDTQLSNRYIKNNELDWEHFLEDIQEPGGIRIPYHKYGVEGEDSVIDISLEKTIVDGEEGINKSPHITEKTNRVGEDGDEIPVEKYVLTVLYSPDYDHVLPEGQGGKNPNAPDYHTGTFGTMYQGHATGRETSTNIHVINVFAKKLKIVKIDQSQKTIATSEAEFALYRKANTEDPSDQKDQIPGLTGSYVLVETLVTDNGDVISGQLPLLSNNEPYYLVETKAPAGYYMLPEPLMVKIDMEGHNTWTKKTDGSTSQARPEPYILSDWLQEALIKVTSLNGSQSSYVKPIGNAQYDSINDTTDASVTYGIINTSGIELPHTGGIGTKIFELSGLILMTGSILYMLNKRRSR